MILVRHRLAIELVHALHDCALFISFECKSQKKNHNRLDKMYRIWKIHGYCWSLFVFFLEKVDACHIYKLCIF